MYLLEQKTAGRLACIAAALSAALLLAPARAQMLAPALGPLGPRPALPAAAVAVATSTPAAMSPACTAPTGFLRFNYRLRHTAHRLASGEPLTIVAIGSSSTAGVGASSSAASYPSRLAVELKQRFPGNDIAVFNRGVGGEETAQMIARFPTGVTAMRPDLVLWQVGTNSVLRDHPLKPHSVLLHEGIDELKDADADVVLIDMQYAPRVITKPETEGMEDQIATAAKEESVDLFARFALMRNWYEVQHIPFDTFLSPDQLHMTDWSYACMAKLLAIAISEAATRPIASAHSAH
jgi:acyl-CoA thioesterase I